ncbi:MAG: hypothetical protein ACRCTR_09645 [Actinomycetota bacterium]
MNTSLFLLLCLLVGIVVAVKSKKLSVMAVLVCTTAGLLLGGTPIGATLNGAVVSAGDAVVQAMAGVLS